MTIAERRLDFMEPNGETFDFDGMTSRMIEDHERPYRTEERALPLVIQPKGGRSAADLANFLRDESARVLRAVYAHGAVLFRGFDIETDRDFEQAILSVRGLRSMRGYFMSEPGRVPVEGTESVFYTNKFYKIGGSTQFGGVHTENYYSTDVPTIQSFWCKRPSWMGGETGLVHMAKVYDDLGDSCREKLERAPCVATAFSFRVVAERYGLSEEAVEAFFRDIGFRVVESGGEKGILLHKPTVLVHPKTGRRALQANVSIELGGLTRAIQKHFVPQYVGSRWWMHRLGWRWREVGLLALAVEHLPRVVRHPGGILGSWFARMGTLFRAISKGRAVAPDKDAPKLVRFAESFTPEDVEALAESIWRHSSVFTWKRGDVLLFDNLQLAHAGMPGFGPRELHVLLMNPIAFEYPPSSGRFAVPNDVASYECVDHRLKELRSET